ncbi:MAG: type I-C CRISPR-associated protein Cas8c/Csd1, partial [Eubacteriales bacterium]|nr:type I-C CRISPR-associated protein Cas8c/Csd1 [Eubacteriales bacterium]
MILQSLADYYEALVRDDADGRIPRYGFSIAKVSFEAHLAPDGRLLALTPLFVTVEQKGKPVQRPRELLAPAPAKRTVGIDANFLCDNAAYFFGFDLKGNRERALECFADAKRLHTHLLARAVGPVGLAVRGFFATFDPDAPCPEIEAQQKALLSGGNIVFSVDGRFAQDDEECRKLWMDHVAVNGSSTLMQCLVTGEIAPVAVLHGNIKGVRGGQAMGTSIVSFNASAFESYGHDGGQGLNAPVSEYAAFAYITALNHLIAQPEHRLFLGDMTIVYWAEKEQAAALDLFGALAGNPAVENTEALIGSVLAHIARGEPVEEVDTAQQFCVLGLAPNAGRLSIRFF